MSAMGHGERGMVTAELAVAIPAVLLVLALGLSGVRLGLERLLCVDAARAGARAAARGDTAASVRAAVSASAPAGATVTIESAPGRVRVLVRSPAPGPLAAMGVAGCAEEATSVPEAPDPAELADLPEGGP